MSILRATLLSGVAAGTIALGTTPAAAFFGPTCIPSFPNCGCTHMTPCPTADLGSIEQLESISGKLEEMQEVMQQIRNPQEALLRAAQGKGSFGIPGLNAVGIDLNGIMSGDLSSLGLPKGITELSDNLGNLGIDADMISAMASGELTPSHFLQVAENAGVDFSALEQAGLSAGNIEALANGDLGAGQVLSIAGNLGMEGDLLSDIGISEQLIQDVASGVADPGRILDIAQNAGLDMAALEGVGLDRDTIAALGNGAGPDAVMGILQKAGFDSSPISALGLDAGTLGRIASGDLPSQAIDQLVAGTGIDPSALVLPGANGPISVPGERPRNRESMVAVPAGRIPGLEGVLSQARGEESTDTSTVNAASSQAMCASDMSLISVSAPPNGFGSDLANIDMAISGANLEAFPENLDAATDAAAMAMAFGIARAYTAQPLLVSALEAVDSFEEMMEQTRSAKDDFAVNDTVRSQLMTARAETASMMTALVSVKAASNINSAFVSPVPLLPHDSRFAEAVERKIREPARERAEAADELKDVAEEHSRFVRAARNGVLYHNLVKDALSIQESLPGIRETINEHEIHKAAMIAVEKVIRNRLRTLYGDDAAGAWETLRPELYNEAGNYLDPDKYETGFAAAKSFSQALTAKRPDTAYGERVYTTARREGRKKRVYSQASETPYSYPSVENLDGMIQDDWKVVPRRRLRPRNDDAAPGIPPGYELVGAFQTYFELLRRTDFAASMRRGEAGIAMTGQFWTEMTTNAPQCISGPLEMTPDNIARRPEMFDLAFDCDHLVWSFGDPGDYIDPSQLGGADAAAWLSKVSIDRVLERTGGPEGVRQTIEEALDDVSGARLESRLLEMGHDGSAEHLEEIRATLRRALADTRFSTRFEFPPES